MMSDNHTEIKVKNPQLFIVAIALGVILNPLNTTMITVALPAIQSEFELTSKEISWLIASYFIVSAIFLPLIGKLSDYYGRKRIFLLGLLLVGISSFLAPLSPNMMVLLGMRTIQAVGTSALYPAGIGMVRSYVEKNQNRVIATLSVFATTSAAFGPTISGLLIQLGGWPVIFYVNFPVILVSALLAIRYIPNDIVTMKTKYKWDIVGILLFGSFMSCWMFFLQALEEGVKVWPLLLAVTLTLAFYFYEKKKAEPFINVNFLRKNLNISFIYVQYVLATVVFFAMLLAMPAYFQMVLHLDSKTAGIMMLSLSVFAMMMTPIATRWTERHGFRFPLLFGSIVGIIGVGLLLTAHQSSPLYWLFMILAILGISNGALSISSQNLLYSFVTKEQSGIASGLLMTSRFIGNILASSLYGVVYATGISDANKNSMTIVLLIVSFVMIPGVFFVTKRKASEGEI
ncbi:MFS transporter [Mesobacillus maritimus]|uniref:MFS transporter n=1 Tax=Mesobacillus maritimus TaxID=1643336 RepID=UPI00203BB82A|nr:MFS transporter [Mesobacillus maritimus]MCM3668555.1 MFS transporter [Mesobacillus maritimus]